MKFFLSACILFSASTDPKLTAQLVCETVAEGQTHVQGRPASLHSCFRRGDEVRLEESKIALWDTSGEPMDPQDLVSVGGWQWPSHACTRAWKRVPTPHPCSLPIPALHHDDSSVHSWHGLCYMLQVSLPARDQHFAAMAQPKVPKRGSKAPKRDASPTVKEWANPANLLADVTVHKKGKSVFLDIRLAGEPDGHKWLLRFYPRTTVRRG